MITGLAIVTVVELLVLRWVLRRERSLGYHEGQLDAAKTMLEDVVDEAERITGKAAAR